MVEKIKQLCNAQGIGINRLEDVLDFGNGAIYKWDKVSPRVDNVKKVADYFGVTVNDLLGYPQTTLSKREERIINMLRGMNEDGQEVALTMITVLSKSPEYIKNSPDKAVEGIA